jgi:hypothetical protein
MVVTRRSEVTIVEEANLFGQKGWEMVAVLNYKDAKGIMAWSAFLKRPCSGSSSSSVEVGDSETSIGIASSVAEHTIGSAISHNGGSAINRSVGSAIGRGAGSSISRVINGDTNSPSKEVRVSQTLESESEGDTFELREEE